MGTSSEWDWKLPRSLPSLSHCSVTSSLCNPGGSFQESFTVNVSLSHFFFLNLIPYFIPQGWFLANFYLFFFFNPDFHCVSRVFKDLEGQSSRWNFRCAGRLEWKLFERKSNYGTYGVTPAYLPCPLCPASLPFRHFCWGTWMEIGEYREHGMTVVVLFLCLLNPFNSVAYSTAP